MIWPSPQVCWGLVPLKGFSDSLADCTKKAVEDFCTPFLHPPRQFTAKAPPPKVDQRIKKSLVERTEVLITDAAAPELLASRLLSGKRRYATTGAEAPFFTNVKVIGRDAAHASTRLLKRPFDCHAELDSLMDEYISGKDSFSQKVWNSHLYSKWWQQLAKKGGSSLSAAKHRFGSYLNPLSKIAETFTLLLNLRTRFIQRVLIRHRGPPNCCKTWMAERLSC